MNKPNKIRPIFLVIWLIGLCVGLYFGAEIFSITPVVYHGVSISMIAALVFVLVFRKAYFFKKQIFFAFLCGLVTYYFIVLAALAFPDIVSVPFL